MYCCVLFASFAFVCVFFVIIFCCLFLPNLKNNVRLNSLIKDYNCTFLFNVMLNTLKSAKMWVLKARSTTKTTKKQQQQKSLHFCHAPEKKLPQNTFILMKWWPLVDTLKYCCSVRGKEFSMENLKKQTNKKTKTLFFKKCAVTGRLITNKSSMFFHVFSGPCGISQSSQPTSKQGNTFSNYFYWKIILSKKKRKNTHTPSSPCRCLSHILYTSVFFSVFVYSAWWPLLRTTTRTRGKQHTSC